MTIAVDGEVKPQTRQILTRNFLKQLYNTLFVKLDIYGFNSDKYSKTCLKRPLKKKTKNCF